MCFSSFRLNHVNVIIDWKDPEARARLGSQSVFYSNKKGYSSHQHEGFLYKKADLRKKWKYWWCVLDIELGEVNTAINIMFAILFVL